MLDQFFVCFYFEGKKLKYERENRMRQKYFEIVKTNETILVYLDISYRLNCEL